MPLLATRLGLTSAVALVAPIINTVTISGTVQEGNTLFSNVTYSNTPIPTPSVTYQWQYSTDGSTGWTNIGGATSSSYLLDDTYAGYFLRVQAQATNAAGSSSLVSSSATVAVDTLYFGNGSDGDVTISSTTFIASDKKYRNLTINSAVGLGTQGFLVQVCRTLTGSAASSAIYENGNPGTTGSTDSSGPPPGNASGGPGGTTGAALGGDGGAGGRGGTTPSSNDALGGSNGGLSGSNMSGGAGGNGGTGTGDGGTHVGGTGNAATLTSTPSTKSGIKTSTTEAGGGGGGGGGGSYYSLKSTTASYGGSGGGEGGGVVKVLAKTIAGSGVFQSKGGDGAAATGTGAGGGGGGGGRVLVGSYSADKASWTILVTGGALGAQTANAPATAGSSGSSYEDYGAGN